MAGGAMRFLALVAACALAGCRGYRIVQTNNFANDDGAIVRVDYGQADKDHVSTFVSPANGREMDYKSKLAVEVTLPDWPEGATFEGREPPFDGERFTAWQCMNFYGPGTSYKSGDGEWIFVASGFTCRVGRREADGSAKYRPVFVGVLCNTPVEKVEKDGRWRKIRPGAATRR